MGHRRLSLSSHHLSPSNRVLFTPRGMVTVPPRHYCTVANPVSRDAQGSVLFDVTGQVRLRHADLEIRLAQDPFPLYPGEVLEKVSASPRPSLPVLSHTAFRRENKLDRGGDGADLLAFTRGRIDSLPLHRPSPNAPFLRTCPQQTCPF